MVWVMMALMLMVLLMLMLMVPDDGDSAETGDAAMMLIYPESDI